MSLVAAWKLEVPDRWLCPPARVSKILATRLSVLGTGEVKTRLDKIFLWLTEQSSLVMQVCKIQWPRGTGFQVKAWMATGRRPSQVDLWASKCHRRGKSIHNYPQCPTDRIYDVHDVYESEWSIWRKGTVEWVRAARVYIIHREYITQVHMLLKIEVVL